MISTAAAEVRCWLFRSVFLLEWGSEIEALALKQSLVNLKKKTNNKTHHHPASLILRWNFENLGCGWTNAVVLVLETPARCCIRGSWAGLTPSTGALCHFGELSRCQLQLRAWMHPWNEVVSILLLLTLNRGCIVCPALGVLRPWPAIFPPTAIHVWLQGQGKHSCGCIQLQLWTDWCLADECAGTRWVTGKSSSLWAVCSPDLSPSYWDWPRVDLMLCQGGRAWCVVGCAWIHVRRPQEHLQLLRCFLPCAVLSPFPRRWVVAACSALHVQVGVP